MVPGEKTRKVRNTNRLLWSFAGADGVEDRHHFEAGYCLVASATRTAAVLSPWS